MLECEMVIFMFYIALNSEGGMKAKPCLNFSSERREQRAQTLDLVLQGQWLYLYTTALL